MTTKIKTFVGANVDDAVNTWLQENENTKVDVLDLRISATFAFVAAPIVVVTVIFREKKSPT